MASDEDKYWAHQNKLWREDRISGGGGHMSTSGFIKKAVKKDALLYVDHNSALGRAIIEDRKERQQMAYETNELSGSLFKNDKKVEGSNQPDYRGSLKINGVEYWQSAWIKTSANGVKFMSFAYQVKEEVAASAPAPAPKPAAPVDDTPF